MRFTKMHGAGNDYIYVNCFDEPVPADPAALAREVSDRHFGIGGDGLVLIGPSDVAQARMRMFNADGSEAQMCGNAIRCVAKFLVDHGISAGPVLAIETGRGVLEVQVAVADGLVQAARVDMGPPILEAARIPTTLPGDPVLDQPLEVGGESLRVTCVSMGNPHCIVFVEEPSDRLVLELGPLVERDPHFPQRVNVEFVQVLSPGEVRMRVWERGSGETLACGTGAAAVCVAGALTGRTSKQIVAHLPGGDLRLEWAADGHVHKTGPAVEVFTGDWQPQQAVAVQAADRADRAGAKPSAK